MKKRLLSCILVLVMLLGMIPTAAFAADYSDADPLPGGSYQVGDTYTGTTKPAAPDKTVWAQVGDPTTEDVLTCTETEHTHDESCKTLTCGHVHTEKCDSLIVGDWTACEEDSHYHQNVCKKHCGLTTGYKCKTNGQNFDPFSGHFLVSDDFCYPGTVILASEVINAYRNDNDFTDDEKAAIKRLIDLIGENVTAFYHHDITRVPLTCGHHEENCYSVTCGKEAHEHDNGCYRQDTVYTWTLKADNNGNNKPDDEETYTVIYDVNGADSGFYNQRTADLAYGTATPKYTNNGGTDEVTPTKANYSFAGWEPNVAEKVTAPASGNTITYTAKWNPITTPNAPNGDTVKELLANYQVNVDCSKEAHTLATYGLVDGCYEIGTVSGSAANGFTVDVTLKAAKYAEHYDNQNAYPAGAHTTTDEDVTITLTYDSSSTSWGFNGTTAVTTFYVNCTQYTVTFVKNNGEDNEATTVFAGQTVTAPAVTKENCTLVGWYNGDTAFDFNTEITEDVRLIAKWTADLPEVLTKKYDWVKVELNDNAAAAQALLDGLVPFVTVTHEDGTIVTAGSAKEWWGANPTKVLGKDLTGVKLGKGTDSINLAITGVKTKTDDYTVTLEDGGTIEFVSDPGIFKDLNDTVKKVIRRAVEKLPDNTDLSKIVAAINAGIEWANNTFEWNIPLIIGDNLPDVITKQDILNFLDKLFSDGVGSFTYMVIKVEKADDPTPNTYNVTFDANGGKGEMAAQTFTENEKQALNANKFTKTDYVFSGWNTADDGTGNAYTDKQEIKVTADMTLYAQWTEIKANVFDLIHVHMDDATTADLNALKGEGAKHVRLESAKYDNVEALLGYRVMAPIDVKSNANWWTENFAKKVTAAEITNVILAADKPIGPSDKIVIPMTGNEKYTVTLGYESVNFDVYGIDIDEILSKLPNWPTTPELPEFPDLDLDDIQTIIDLIQALKNMDLDIDCKDIEEALEHLKNAATKESIEEALSDLKDALQRIDVDDLQDQLNELLAELGQMDKEALIAKIKALIKNQIPADALKCMTPAELKELLKSLITKKSCSLSCLCIKISKKSAPVAPTDDELKDLLLEKVTVDCDSTTAGHADATYGWIKDGVTLGKVVETETTWTCTATLAGWVYADAYNKDVAPDHPVTGVKPADAAIDLTWDGDEWIPGDDITFHVNCDKAITVKHTVTFDYDYDSWVVHVLVEDGKTVTAPASGVERTGYVIDGWYLDGKEYAFATTPVTDDITLVADWKVDRNNNGIADEKEYVTVTYSDGVANEVVFADQIHDTLLEGDATPAFVGTPSRIGYTFKGWEPEVSETVTESVVYVAQWERNREPITPVGPTAPSVKVKYLNTKDHVAYIIGYENGTIRPRGEITRAEVATIFFRLMTDKARNQYWTTENDFNDVAEGQWFNLAVSTLNAAGVIVDAEYGNFRPNDPITRAELAVMAAQFCTVEGKLPKTSFTDVSKDHWAIDEIKLIEYAGWIEGYPDGTFRPDATITRAEAITIINRMLERAVEDSDMLEGMLTFIDCPTNEWFYEAVQEATNSHDYKRTKEEVEDYGYCYEIWTELEERPDWAAMEKTWLSQH